jgi:hypothetical protein
MLVGTTTLSVLPTFVAFADIHIHSLVPEHAALSLRRQPPRVVPRGMPPSHTCVPLHPTLPAIQPLRLPLTNCVPDSAGAEEPAGRPVNQ